jgi:hypothetical protein
MILGRGGTDACAAAAANRSNINHSTIASLVGKLIAAWAENRFFNSVVDCVAPVRLLRLG